MSAKIQQVAQSTNYRNDDRSTSLGGPRTWPTSGQICSGSGPSWSRQGYFEISRRSWSQSDQSWSIPGQCWPRLRSTAGHCWSMPVNCWPRSPNIGSELVEAGPKRPTLAEVSPNLGTLGQTSAKVGKVGPNLAQVRPDLGRVGPNWANIDLYLPGPRYFHVSRPGTLTEQRCSVWGVRTRGWAKKREDAAVNSGDELCGPLWGSTRGQLVFVITYWTLGAQHGFPTRSWTNIGPIGVARRDKA